MNDERHRLSGDYSQEGFTAQTMSDGAVLADLVEHEVLLARAAVNGLRSVR